MKTTQITFKTKVRKLHNGDGTTSDYIEPKRVVGRVDCNLRPHEHTYYNSDLFPAMLNGAYNKVIGGKAFLCLESLPAGVTVDTSKFLAIVTVTLPDTF